MLRTRFRQSPIAWLTAAFAAGVAALAIAAGAATASTDRSGTAGLIGQAGVEGTIVGMNLHNNSHTTVTTIPVGLGVHPEVQVTGFHGTPTGQVTVYIYPSSDCSGDWNLSFTAPLVDGTVDVWTNQFTRTTEGYKSARATYFGDATYAKAIGPCKAEHFVKTTPGINLSIHNSKHVAVASVPFTEPVHASVYMDGRGLDPTGYMLVRTWANGTCDGTDYDYTVAYLDDDARADSILPRSFTEPGLRSYRAHYSGDDANNAVWSDCVKVGGTKIAPLLITSLHDAAHDPAPAAALVGEQVHPRIQVMGDFVQPTGTVKVELFNDATCATQFGAPIATLAEATADNAFFDAGVRSQPGVMSWRVVYGGDTFYTMAKGDCMTQRWYGKPDVALVIHNASHAAVSSVTAGTKVHLRAGVTGQFGTPTGSATIRVADNASCSNGTSIGSGSLSGGVLDDMAIDYTPKAAGTVWFQATYKGDDTYVQRKSACVALTVTASQPTPAPTTVPGPTAKPTAAPSQNPTGTPKPTAAASATPAPTAAPSAAPSSVPSVASAGPEATDGPFASPDPDATMAPISTVTPASSPAAPTTDVSAAGGAAAPGSGASSGDLPILPIALFLLLVVVVGFWFIAVSRRRNPAAAR